MVITAAAKSDPEVTASCKVTVKRLPDSIDIEPVGGHIPYGDNTVLVYIPYGDGERYVSHRSNNSVTFNFTTDDEYVLSDVKWQVYSGANRVSAARNEDGSFTVTARTNSLSGSESQATVVIRAASTYDNTIMGTYNIVLARGISSISMRDLQYDYNTTTSFRVPQPTIQPANATFKNSSDFIWMSSNPDVVSISEGGQCTINGTGVAYISMCPKYDYGYINGGSPDVTGGFSVTVLKKAKSVVIAMVSDEFDEVISIGEGVAPAWRQRAAARRGPRRGLHAGRHRGRTPARRWTALYVEHQQRQPGQHRAGRRGNRLLPDPLRARHGRRLRDPDGENAGRQRRGGYVPPAHRFPDH